MSSGFFPQRPDSKPTIYAYKDTHPQYRGLLKVGYTAGDALARVENLDGQHAGVVVQRELFPDELFATDQDDLNAESPGRADRALDFRPRGLIAAHRIHSDCHHR